MLTDEQYTQHVLARASTQWHGEKLDFDDLKDVLSSFIKVGNRLDLVKKALMYGREIVDGTDPFFILPVETVTPPIPETDQAIAHAILGIATEGVELVEAFYAYLFQGKPLDHINLQEEAGDVQWYRALLLHALNQTHVENITQNDAKLEKRFGPVSVGFTCKAANERNLVGEREVLQGKTIVDRQGNTININEETYISDADHPDNDTGFTSFNDTMD